MEKVILLLLSFFVGMLLMLLMRSLVYVYIISGFKDIDVFFFSILLSKSFVIKRIKVKKCINILVFLILL